MLLNTLSCEPMGLDRHENLWSGRRESDPRPTAWKAVTLPLSYSRLPQGLMPPLAALWHGDPRLKPWLTSHALQNLELTERLELSTSPLPRECSTTELRQLCRKTFKTNLLKLLPLQSYRERSRPSMTRKAKNPNRIHVSD